MTRAEDEMLLRATFDRKLKTFWYVSVIALMAISVVAILMIPFWLLGLGSLMIETAGQSSVEGQSDAGPVGVVDAREFRNRVLKRRDIRVDERLRARWS